MKAGQPSEPSLHELIQHLDGMVYRCRPNTDGTMEYVSDGCYALTGYRPHELLFNDRVSFERLTLADDRGRVRVAIDAALAERRRFDVEYRIHHADGSVRWVWERGYGVFGADGDVVALDGFVQDITLLKRSEIALAEAERRFRDIFDNAQEGIFQTTRAGTYLRVNRALARIYGYDSPEDLIAGLADIGNQLYVDPGRRGEFVRCLEQSGRVLNFESQVYRRDGSIIWISENARLVTDADGQTLYYEGTVEDISERKAWGERIEYQAKHDALTELPNRSLLRERLQAGVARCRRDSRQLALLFVDLDHFKDVNDTLGHAAGDRLIQAVARRLVESVRDGDTVARLGGDEFVLLLEGEIDDGRIVATSERVLGAVSQPYQIDGRELRVTCSLGISVFPRDGSDADTLLQHADTAMYSAKHEGRNTFQRFRPNLRAAVSERLELGVGLRRALEREEFELHYQPQVDLGDGGVLGFESLVRWRTPEGELLLPGRFIGHAEESGLIEPLSDWVLNEACNFARGCAATAGMTVSVNISPRQFRRSDFVASVQRALARSGLPAPRLELEITENCIIESKEHFVATVHNLHDLGVRVALDDFGTGYCSLAWLKSIPVDRLKIDRAFVPNAARVRPTPPILPATSCPGPESVLPGVAGAGENEAEGRSLLDVGCDQAQGYLFGRPMPGPDLAALLRGAARSDSPYCPARI